MPKMGIRLRKEAQQRPTFDIYGRRQRSLRLYKPRPMSGYTARWIRMPLSTEVGLRPGHIVLDGDQFPPPKKRRETQQPNLRSIYADQTAGRIKMPLGAEVDHGPDHIVIDGDPAPLERGTAAPPCCWPMSVVPKRSPPKHL